MLRQDQSRGGYRVAKAAHESVCQDTGPEYNRTMIFDMLRTGPQLPGRDSRQTARFLLLSFSIAFVFVLHTTLALSDDAAQARKKLDDEYIPFTPKKFFHYVFMNKVEIVDLFLEGGISRDAADAQGRGALHIAAGAEDGEILSLLLERGADVNQGDKNGTTPLCVAADDGHVDNVKMLLRAKADISALCGVDMNTPLHKAASDSHGSVVKVLIEAGAALETRNRVSNTPLHAAVRSNNKSVIQLLVEAGADVAAKNNSGETPLHIAVTRRSASMVKALLTAGAPLEARNARGATPLWLTANYDAAEMTQLLIEAGANPEAKASDGDTPMQIAEKARAARVIEILRNAPQVTLPPQTETSLPKAAAPSDDPKAELERLGFRLDTETFFNRLEAGDTRVVSLFLQAGFSPATQNEVGRTPLWEAIESKDLEMVTALIADGADPDEVGRDNRVLRGHPLEHGATSIMAAVNSGNIEILKLLVTAKADVSKVNDYKMGPLEIAATHGYAEMVEVLIAAGAELKGAGGHSILFGPVAQGRVEVVKILLQAGVKLGKDKKVLLDTAAKHPEIKALLSKAH